jgi:hypothetical protein
VIIPQVDCESMSYILDGSPYTSNSPHFSQDSKRSIKLVLLFWYPATQETETKPTQTSPLKLAVVKVPSYTPISRVRDLINFVENYLTKFYGPSKRANYVLVAEENSEVYEPQYDLPLNGVSYV